MFKLYLLGVFIIKIQNLSNIWFYKRMLALRGFLYKEAKG
jgi:hypothetical protein